MLSKKYEKPYECNHQSTIFFGRYKGQKHEVLKDDPEYCKWILSTEDGFAESTKTYINKYITLQE